MESQKRVAKEQQSMGKVFSERYGYGDGTGAKSIGADPRTRRHYKWKGCFDVLAKYLEDNITDLNSGREGFNHVTIVIYFGENIRPQVDGSSILGKKESGANLGEHRDAIWTWKRDGCNSRHGTSKYPEDRNSQEEGTDVVTVSLGDSGELSMHRYFHCQQGPPDKPERNDTLQKISFIPTIYYELHHGHVFVLRLRDEKPQGEHGQFLKHSVLKQGPGISAAVVLRSVKSTAMVSDDDDTIYLGRKENEWLNKVDERQSDTRAEIYDNYKVQYEREFTIEHRSVFTETIRNCIRQWPMPNYSSSHPDKH
jgi:hypothetical protein